MANRETRRRAERAMNRLKRRGTAELEGVNASCAWPKCQQLVVFNAPTFEEASDRMREHYRDKHGGRQP